MIYLDTSALVKLVLIEAESTALRHYLAERLTARVSSVLARVELRRAIRAASAVGRVEFSRLDEVLLTGSAVIAGLTLLPLDDSVQLVAGDVGTSVLRSLDAVHLASALQFRNEMAALITYDQRMVEAATAAGLPVASPA